MKKKIKILLFSSLYPSSVRPSHGIFVETRLKHLLASDEIEVQVVAPVPWFPSTYSGFGEWSLLAKIPHHELWNNVFVSHPRYFLPPKIGMNLAPFLMAIFCIPSLRRLQKSFDFDIIDAHFYYPDGVAAALIAKYFGKPFVVTARGSDINLISQYRIPRSLIIWAAHKAQASIGVCNALISRLENLGADPSKLLVLRNGVDLNLFSPLDKVEARKNLGLMNGNLLLSVGNLIDLKGHDIAIKALQYIPGVNLAIIGKGKLLDELKDLALRLGVHERVQFVGPVIQQSLSQWYSAADILVLCSSREGWANVLLESMSCGTPVIATAVGGTPEVVQSDHVGRLMSARTPECLAQCVQEIFSDYPDRNQVRAYAELFSWDETTKGQIHLFQKISKRE